MKKRTHIWTDEQKEFLKVHYPKNSRADLLNLFNLTFATNIKLGQLIGCLKNNRITSGRTGHFSAGHVPANKGTRGVYNIGGNITSFQKGQVAHNYKPIGYERVDRDGYLLVKVQDDGPWHKRWRAKHRVVWEEVYGEIPKDNCLIFLDQNKQNVSLENLRLISKAQLSRMNQHELISNDPDVTETGIILSEIYTKIGEINKK